MRPFLIIGLPRSRTAWLAAFLTHGPVHCFHELLFQVQSFEQYAAALGQTGAEFAGDSDSGLASLFDGEETMLDRVLNVLDAPRIVRIRREVSAVARSYEQVGVPQVLSLPLLEAAQDRLDAIEARGGVLSATFDALENEACIRSIWHHVTRDEVPFPAERYAFFRRLNVQLHHATFWDTLPEAQRNLEALMKGTPCAS